MSEPITDNPSSTRRLTDAVLLVVAVAAVATWVWRRLRRPATVDAGTAVNVAALDDKVRGTVGSPPGGASV
jgi:multidrug resistance efflux pump